MKEEQNKKVWELLEMCYYGHLDQVKELISQGIDANSMWENGNIPLKAAIDGENDDIVEYLLSIGAKNDAVSQNDLKDSKIQSAR